MEQLLTYLLKSTALLSIFFLIYQLLLRNDTSFLANRRFLFLGIIASLLLPAVEFTRVILVESSSIPLNIVTTEGIPELPNIPENAIDWWQLGGITYFVGLCLLLIRFLIQLFSLLKLISHGTRSRDGKFVLIASEKIVTPFSFFQYIVFNPELHSAEELKIILEHEKIHASQYHSADVLLTNLAASVLWFNPLSWWYRKSLIQNLEYLADKETVAKSVPKKEYQQALVKISVADFQPALANNFYQSLIKKRIVMLNKKTSGKYSFLKIGMAFPLVLSFMFFFNVKTEAQVQQDVSVSHKISTIINKNTTEGELSEMVAMFKEEGISLKFEKLEYNKSGLLANIAISFVKENGQTGNVNFTKPEGLGDIQIALENDNLTIDTVTPSVNSGNLFKKVGEKPLYIINNKEYTTSDLEGKKIWIKGTISAFSGKESAGKYSGKAEDGVIIIDNGEILDDFQAALKQVDNKGENVLNHYLSIIEGESPRLITLESSVTEYIVPPAENIIASQDNSSKKLSSVMFFQDGKKPLFIVDGEIKTDLDQQTLDPNAIEKIHVYKDKEAIKKYGEKGKNGVVIITLKSKEDQKAEGQENNKSFRYEAQKIIINDDSGKDSSKIQILGVSKVELDPQSNVLYVVDGKIMPDDFDSQEIDPESIESITVLKGAKATAKYGEKAAEGAIEIHLKK